MAIAVHDIPKRFATSVALEIALLILICAPDQDICTMAVNCISLLCEETVITQEINNPSIGQLSLLENIDVYMELSAPSAVVAGIYFISLHSILSVTNLCQSDAIAHCKPLFTCSTLRSCLSTKAFA